jgi:hypothetical protein
VSAPRSVMSARSAWTAASAPPASPAEIALGVQWVAGLSRTGKPVYFRKWYHCVPVSDPVGGSPDIAPTQVTALATAAQALVGVVASYGITMGSPSGRFAGVASVSPMYENHQMPRGRRRKALVTASGKYQGPSINIPEEPIAAD